jgi:hypothetical protein
MALQPKNEEFHAHTLSQHFLNCIMAEPFAPPRSAAESDGKRAKTTESER